MNKIKTLVFLFVLTLVLLVANIMVLNYSVSLRFKVLAQRINLIQYDIQDIQKAYDSIPFKPYQDPVVQIIQGKASWYDYNLSGIAWSKDHRTVAARDWPRRSTLRICNLDNQQCVDALVNDFGPEEAVHPDRIVDLSSYAFSKISDLKHGVINVSVEDITNKN